MKSLLMFWTWGCFLIATVVGQEGSAWPTNGLVADDQQTEVMVMQRVRADHLFFPVRIITRQKEPRDASSELVRARQVLLQSFPRVAGTRLEYGRVAAVPVAPKQGILSKTVSIGANVMGAEGLYDGGEVGPAGFFTTAYVGIFEPKMANRSLIEAYQDMQARLSAVKPPGKAEYLVDAPLLAVERTSEVRKALLGAIAEEAERLRSDLAATGGLEISGLESSLRASAVNDDEVDVWLPYGLLLRR
jgi:hypothetical protein